MGSTSMSKKVKRGQLTTQEIILLLIVVLVVVGIAASVFVYQINAAKNKLSGVGQVVVSADFSSSSHTAVISIKNLYSYSVTVKEILLEGSFGVINMTSLSDSLSYCYPYFKFNSKTVEGEIPVFTVPAGESVTLTCFLNVNLQPGSTVTVLVIYKLPTGQISTASTTAIVR